MKRGIKLRDLTKYLNMKWVTGALKRKNIYKIIGAFVLLLGITACQDGSHVAAIPSTSSPSSAITPPVSETDPTSEFEKSDYSDKDDMKFSDLSGWKFVYGSGAGGWETDLEIREDGSFGGYSVQFNGWETGDDYPEGTCYVGDFYGKFTGLVKTGDFEYSMRCDFGRGGDEGSGGDQRRGAVCHDGAFGNRRRR